MSFTWATVEVIIEVVVVFAVGLVVVVEVVVEVLVEGALVVVVVVGALVVVVTVVVVGFVVVVVVVILELGKYLSLQVQQHVDHLVGSLQSSLVQYADLSPNSQSVMLVRYWSQVLQHLV